MKMIKHVSPKMFFYSFMDMIDNWLYCVPKITIHKPIFITSASMQK